jgi:hypothetical protein
VDLGPYIALAVLTLGIGAADYFWPNRRKRVNRGLAARPRALVHDAQGTVRLTGRIRRTGELLQAPLSGRPCVAYELVVDAPPRMSGPGMDARPRLVEVGEACPFLVADESGEARVDTSGPFLMSLSHDLTGDTDGCKYPDEHRALASFLLSLDVVPTNWLGRWRRFHYAEGVLEEGKLVAVSAESVLEVDAMGERAGPRSQPQRLVLRGTEAVPLLISDRSDAGTLDS